MASRHKKKKSSIGRVLTILVLAALELVILAGIFFVILQMKNKKAASASAQVAAVEAEQEQGNVVVVEAVATPTPTPSPTPTQPPFSPHAVESTEPANYISTTSIQVDGVTLDSISEYQADEEISFGLGEDYTDVDGIVTFRGNNFRSNPTYGVADLTENAFGESWIKTTGSLAYGEESWSGSGWTGQPLMEKWSAQDKKYMNMYDWAKADDDLVEVIYACMDGYVYFLDLETGEPTRDALYLGYTFKGAGALDPRGYPILYVGAGYNSNNGTAHVFVINLLDCSVMYEFGANDSFSLRGSLSFFDSSALVDAETDTLIYPGENGILYLIKLNTQYDAVTGTLSIDPGKVTKWNYYGTRSGSSSYWLGMEDSAVIYGGYLFVADNGGNFMCLNINTLELVWVQDILDDSNSTPVLSIENDHPYIYVSTSFHLGWRSSDAAEVPIWKLDAETGEIVWQTSYTCYSVDGVSGGVQSTIAVGDQSLSDYIYVTVSRTPSTSMGVLACLNKQTGEVVWEHESVYAWSSPVCVYNSDGSAVVIYCNAEGEVYMLNGESGEVLDTMEMGSNVEASPAVYKNRLVVGTRGCRIYGVELK
jgi:outer membrane protein assembly factor BamB